MIITRFAPSPTGVLHTGGARTALFNYLYAKKMGGKFLLRIEDTDLERSKQEYVHYILESLEWLGIEWDAEVVFQAQRCSRHANVAHELLDLGMAYRCYSTQEEIAKFRESNPHGMYISPWRDRNQSMEGPYAIRLKVDREGSTTIKDMVMGSITVEHSQIDDMVLLRSDGSPTYMLAVVVDDHDMGITHVLRGDDHLTNAFRQSMIYRAMGWDIPEFGHIPLIHDKEGHKLSKRNGALGVHEYRSLGYLPEAVCNHLLRLGWSHGDEEIISRGRAVELFDIDGIGKSPARFDIDKLNHINGHYVRSMELEVLFGRLKEFLPSSDPQYLGRVLKGLEGLRQRGNTLKEIAEGSLIYLSKQEPLDEKSLEVIGKTSHEVSTAIVGMVRSAEKFTASGLKEDADKLAAASNIKIAQIMQFLRAAILGTFAAPGIFDVMEILGQDECIRRMEL